MKALETWLTTACHLKEYRIAPLAGDASFRRYFRIAQGNQTWVAMDASAEKNSCQPFIAIAKALRSQGLLTPEIIAQDLEQGFLLLTDFGDRLYLSELESANANQLYHSALDALSVLQQCRTVTGWPIQPFTASLMRNELNLFREWFLEKHIGITLTNQENQMLATCFDFLTASAAAQPQVFMHRDYHSANLLILPNDQVGILDFQDAFMGPVTYDLVSLLRDCYIAWPDEQVKQWVLQYREKIGLKNISEEQFLRWFDLMGMQRHLKALLTFSRKYRRDGNARYLQHVPRTLNYILTVGQRYAECRPLTDFLTDRVQTQCVE